LGRSRGGLSTKIHLIADELGLPLGFVLTGGQTHDCTQALTLLSERQPEAVLADKGYDTDAILNHLAERGIQAVIPPRATRKIQRTFDRTLYRQRNRIERTFAHLKQFRRLATRFDKLKQNFHATVAIACSSRWLRQYVDTP
jgi:transposase